VGGSPWKRLRLIAKATYLRAPVKSLRESRESLTGPAPRTNPWEKLFAHCRIDPHQPGLVGDLRIIQYTSSTTATQGAVLNHFNMSSKRPAV
jgi:long-chain acyl-CoA synthetase